MCVHRACVGAGTVRRTLLFIHACAPVCYEWISYSVGLAFYKVQLSPPFCFGVWECWCSWGGAALQPNWHSPVCAPLLSFCQHHHCVELSQARNLTDRQMGVVDFSNITPSRCPPCAQQWGSMHMQKDNEEEKPQFATFRFSFAIQELEVVLRKNKKGRKSGTGPDMNWSEWYNQKKAELDEWVSICCQTLNLTLKIDWQGTKPL